jgi:hypothetical protein
MTLRQVETWQRHWAETWTWYRVAALPTHTPMQRTQPRPCIAGAFRIDVKAPSSISVERARDKGWTIEARCTCDTRSTSAPVAPMGGRRPR